MSKRDFLTLLDCSPEELKDLIRRSAELKTLHTNGEVYQPFPGRTAAMILQLSSTRTRSREKPTGIRLPNSTSTFSSGRSGLHGAVP